jgi:hypothetical protein
MRLPLLLLLPILACTTKAPGDSGLVVGLQGEDVVSTLGVVRVNVDVGGQRVATETIATLGNATALPKELTVTGASDARVDVRVDGYLGTNPDSGETPILTRLASTQIVGGSMKLLRVNLEWRCVLGLPGGGGPGGPACNAPETCIGGRCAQSFVLPQDLESYTTSWPHNAPDACKPNPGDTPIVVLGTGQTDYLPLVENQELALEKGPQGGHHIWIAARMKNLKQSGSTTTISGMQPDTGLSAPPTSFVFTFDKDEGGFCKLYGLRYQLDTGGADYKAFLGKPLDVKVEIADRAGLKGSATVRIKIASQILCPAGLPGCG